MQALAQNEVFTAGQLTVSSFQVSPQATVREVYDLFSDSAALEALAITDGHQPVGLITRTKLLFTLSRRFGYELHAKHPITSIANTDPLIVCEDEPLDAVIEKACARPPKDVYDEVIVTDDAGSYTGLLSVKELIIQQSVALTRSVLLREMATARSEELERINQVKSHFLANVTHELRSPVNAIVGLTQLLKLAADQGATDQMQERLRFLMSTATHLRAVITNILDMSKIEAGKMDVARVEVDVVPLLEEIAENARILVGAKPVSVHVDSPVPEMTVSTDPMKLRQILINLTSNAAKFTESGRIDITLSLDEGIIAIGVSDTGTGIRQEDLSLIFAAFGQVEDAATKTHEGTGLGLAISKNLAELISGSLSVNSTYGKGTNFTLSLPIHTIAEENEHE